MSFETLGLGENVLRAVTECGYAAPTPIQQQAIPIILTGRDLVGLAQTGTGKTAGFTLPMIEILSGGRARARMPRSLILSPTRELAAQIAENFDLYGKYTKLSKALLVGGTSMEEQIKKLERGVDVLIATPGRLIDLFERGRILLSDIKILVIDEADRMMDMGFIPDIEKIVSLIPPVRQTLLFSATMPPEIRKLTQKFQSNPKEVAVSPPSSTTDKVDQFIVWCGGQRKRETLDSLLRREKVKNAFIFSNRKRDADTLAKWLAQQGYGARPMHGDMDQKSRTATLQDFKDGKITLLVCSDVAARGLDVDDISHVFNFDIPFHAEDYVHRIGRTGRAGKSGRAWSIAVRGGDEDLVAAIEKLTGRKIPPGEGGGDDAPAGRGEALSGGRQRRSGPSPAVRASTPPPRDGRSSSPRPAEQRTPRHAPRTLEQVHAHAPDLAPVDEEDNDAQPGVRGFGDSMPGFFGKSGKAS